MPLTIDPNTVISLNPIGGPNPFEAQDPKPTNTKKKVFVMFNIDGEEKSELYTVIEFNVTYDTRGVLTIRQLDEGDLIAVHFGPGTWKYYEFLEGVIVEE